MKKPFARLIPHYGALAIFLVVQLFPFYWMVTTSFKTPNEAVQSPPLWVPKRFNLDAFEQLFTRNGFGDFLLNSIIICVTSMVFTIVFSTLAGYAFARWSFPGRGLLLGLLMLSTLLPFISLLGPTFMIIRNANLLDTRLGLILVFINGGIPLATWMLYLFLQSVPREIEEAAAVDGASRPRTFVQVILPLSLPGLAATSMITFINFWNELLFPLALTLTERSKTLTVGLSELPGLFESPYHLMAAAGTITAIPAILLIIFWQRYLMQGIVAGAIK